MMKNITTMPRYEEYKDSGVEWLGEIPSGWEVIRFHDLFKFSKGLNITKENLQDEGIFCVTYGEIHSKYGFELRPEIHPLRCVDVNYLQQNEKSLLKFGDFIFADTSEDYQGAGNFTYLNSNELVMAGYHTLICRLKRQMNERYVAYVLDSESFRSQVHSSVKGVKVFSITQNILKSTRVWLATKFEQQVIANFLDQKTTQIDQAIAIKEQQIELLKEHKQIIIQQAVTQGLDPNVPMKASGVDWIGKIPAHWEVRPLKHLLKIQNKKIETNKCGFKYLGMECINSFDGTKNDIETEAEGLATVFNKGQILFGKLRPYLAKAYLADFDGVCSTEFLVYETNTNNLANFYLNLLLSNQFIRIVDSSTYGSKMPRASADFIGNLKIVRPPENEQIAISAYIDEQKENISNCIQLQQQQIQKLKEYKTTLINSAVTGKIKITPEMVSQ